MTNEIFAYMKETSRQTDSYTLQLLESLKDEGKNIYRYVSHLPILRNKLNGDLTIPKARNSLGRLIYECFGGKDLQKIVPVLSFIELSTVASYVLDDIIDEQPERQGDISTWQKYGINKAIIAGSTQTFIALTALNDLDVSDSQKLKINQLSNNMWLKLWIGQGFNEEMKEGTTIDDYINRSYNICGVMFDSVAQMCGICANVNERELQTSSNIGRNYGIGVMIRNDLADLLPKITQHSKALSKRSYEDLRKGIWTYPIIHAFQKSTEKEKFIIRNMLGRNCEDEEYAYLYELLKKNGSIESTLEVISKYKELAKTEVSNLPECKSRGLLLEQAGLLENLRGYV